MGLTAGVGGMEIETIVRDGRRSTARPRAVFMAFGTKGDVHPIGAIAVAFATDKEVHHDVFFVTHSSHKELMDYLDLKQNINCYSLSTPPVLSANQHELINSEFGETSFSERKKVIQSQHRKECLFVVEQIFGEEFPNLNEDFIVINFFALEGWSLAELFRVRCVIAAPYVVPYSPPSSFERQFKKEIPLLYKYFKDAPLDKVNWRDVIHWMWPLFTEDWCSWRQDCLNLSPFAFTDPVTSLPTYNINEESPLLLYGFSNSIVECPGYWPYNAHVCGFWFLPLELQFSCEGCKEMTVVTTRLCPSHINLQQFLEPSSCSLIFVGLSSIGSMGFLQNPRRFISVLKSVLDSTKDCRFVLFSSGYKPLDEAIRSYSNNELTSCREEEDGILLFSDQLFCFSGSIPYSWLFPKCTVAIHHGGSGTTAAALHAGIPQIICPFMLDQFYWAERMCWIGVSPEVLQKNVLIPDNDDDISINISAETLKKAILLACSPKIKERALEVSGIILPENGIQEAVKILKEKIIHSS